VPTAGPSSSNLGLASCEAFNDTFRSDDSELPSEEGVVSTDARRSDDCDVPEASVVVYDKVDTASLSVSSAESDRICRK
jgi:hypothetical protein